MSKKDHEKQPPSRAELAAIGWQKAFFDQRHRLPTYTELRTAGFRSAETTTWRRFHGERLSLDANGIERRLCQGAVMVAMGLTAGQASVRLGLHKDYLREAAEQFPVFWKGCLEAAQSAAQIAAAADTEQSRARGRALDFAAVVALGLSKTKAAVALGAHYEAIRKHARANAPLVSAESARIRRLLKLAGSHAGNNRPNRAADKPSRKIEERIVGVVRLIAAGMSGSEACRRFGCHELAHTDLRKAYPERWARAWRETGLPDIWDPRFDRVQLRIRVRMAQAAPIVASGVPQRFAARRLGFRPIDLRGYITKHKNLWESLIAAARQPLRIPEGLVQRAGLFRRDGKRWKAANLGVNGKAVRADRRGRNPPPNAFPGKQKRTGRAGAGGRPRKWDPLWKIIQEQDALPKKPKDTTIASKYNQVYAAAIAQPKSKMRRATAATVKKVRCIYGRLGKSVPK